MKQTAVILAATFLFFAQPGKAQDSGVSERLNKLSGHVEDLLAAQAEQQKRIAGLARELETLREQAKKPSADVAQQEELRKLAEKVQEIDQKRVTDNEKIMREIEKLSRVGAYPQGGRAGKESWSKTAGTSGTGKFFEYTIERGDTFSTIALAYREKGYNVTAEQIQQANPDLEPTSLQIGQKVFIPVPKQ